MKIPDRNIARLFIEEAERLNPGEWVKHSENVAQAAYLIADHHPILDPETAYILGYLHDIGRRAGVSGMRHILDGYRFLNELGYPDAARICLTHSFPYQDYRAGSAVPDWTGEEAQWLKSYLENIQYHDYDRLIQLCDTLANSQGYCLMEKRLVNVVLRYGFNEFTILKWRAFFELRDAFSKAIGRSVYEVLPGVVENTFCLM